MSETEYHKGTLTPIKTDDPIKYLCDQMDKENISYDTKEIAEDYNGNIIYWFDEQTYNTALESKFYYKDGKLYSMDNTALESDVCVATMDEKGVIHYYLSYYNGGCGFSEALEDALDDLK